MQFFLRYSYIWKFPHPQEEEYDRFVYPANLISLRLVAFITVFGMSLFLIIDWFRQVDYSFILVVRSLALLAGFLVMMLSFRKSFSVSASRWSVVFLTIVNFGISLFTATLTSIPSYYLTNLVFLILVLVVTASGLNFRYSLFLNIACLSTFILYSQFIKRDPFYFSQYPHLISIFVYISIVGVVLEFRRKQNFLQYSDLEKQKRKVEELNQQKNRIISILSHDVASPLNSLSGLLSLQSKGHIEADELRPFLAEVSDQLTNVSSLLQGLVRWSRSQMEGFVPQKKQLNVTALLEENVKLLQPLALDKVLNLKLNAKHNLFAHADEEMIRIAIRNVISNAVKYGRQGTDVVVESFLKDGSIVIQVTNEGPELPHAVRERLFTYQMPSMEGTSGEKGTGLGLALAAFFVRFHEGDIYLAFSTSQKTQFVIELPDSDLAVKIDQMDLLTSNFSR